MPLFSEETRRDSTHIPLVITQICFTLKYMIKQQLQNIKCLRLSIELVKMKISRSGWDSILVDSTGDSDLVSGTNFIAIDNSWGNSEAKQTNFSTFSHSFISFQ